MKYDYSELLKVMSDKNISYRKLSEMTGIALSTLHDKLNNRTEFKASEIQAVSAALELEKWDRYFFTPQVRHIEP
jgi:DNA-binding Xre family transcriptional regulator